MNNNDNDWVDSYSSNADDLELIDATLRPDAEEYFNLAEALKDPRNSKIKPELQEAIRDHLANAGMVAAKLAQNLMYSRPKYARTYTPTFSAHDYQKTLKALTGTRREHLDLVNIFFSVWASAKIEVDKPDPSEAVSFETFLTHADYLGVTTVYPEVLKECNQIVASDCTSFILTGGVGSAKSSIGVWVLAYRIYLLSLHPSPQELYDLDPDHEMVLTFSNLSKEKATSGGFARLSNVIKKSHYFTQIFPCRVNRTEIHFPCNIVARSVKPEPEAMTGDNVICSFIDEINLLPIHSADAKKGKLGLNLVQAWNSITKPERVLLADTARGVCAL